MNTNNSISSKPNFIRSSKPKELEPKNPFARRTTLVQAIAEVLNNSSYQKLESSEHFLSPNVADKVAENTKAVAAEAMENFKKIDAIHRQAKEDADTEMHPIRDWNSMLQTRVADDSAENN
ncbi:MAG: hypothetical protein K0S74_1844 [Chlamydiales bacterium]|jgi:hypothetical protein|nr:hypothetical protein [Chlamydiales bacterium]